MKRSGVRRGDSYREHPDLTKYTFLVLCIQTNIIAMAYEHLDIAKMSQETKVSIFEIRTILGIPLSQKSTATTVEAAKSEYESADETTEKSVAAWRQWDYLLLQKIKRVKTFEAAKILYEESPENSKSEATALSKCHVLATEVEEIFWVYKKYPENSTGETLAFKEWLKHNPPLSELRDELAISLQGSWVRYALIKKIATFF